MLVTRKEENSIIEVTYNSSNILSSSYDKLSQTLIITFKGGKRYKYPKVKPTDYLRFEIADSQGSVFNTHIKSYAFEKLEDINPDQLILEIERDQHKENLMIRTERLQKLIDAVSFINDDTYDIPYNKLEGIISAVNAYKEAKKMCNDQN